MRTLPLLLPLSLLALSAPAFAYHHASTGKGLGCGLNLVVHPLVNRACAVRVVSTQHIDTDGVDVNGHHYQTVRRLVDTAPCLEDTYSATGKVVGDTSQNLKSDLDLALDYATADASAAYRNLQGTIDSESDARGNITYIYFDPTMPPKRARRLSSKRWWPRWRAR